SSTLGTSNGMAPVRSAVGITSAAGTNRNSAWGSTKRRMSQGQATRSTCAFSRVIHFTSVSFRGAGGNGGLVAERVVQAVEPRRALVDAGLVRQARDRQAEDHAVESRGFGTAVAAVLEVQVVHDLGDRRERRIPQPEAADEHLERAEPVGVGELGPG